MSVIQIREARREGARVVVGLAGVSGSGKTRTALEIAYGLANYNPKKIGFLDTENRRGSLYSDALHQHPTHPTTVPFLIGDLHAPFSPQRYIDAVLEFQKAGVEVLIIDSASHEWEGQGGAQDIAEAGTPKVPNWNKAKAQHKRFVNTLLQCDMHIVVCLRAREKAKPERKNIDGEVKLVYTELGLQAITERNFMFEMTVSFMMHDQGKRRDVLKPLGPLESVLDKKDGYLGSVEGKAIRDWIDGGKQLDPKVEKWRNRLLSITEQGVSVVEESWKQTPAGIQKQLGAGFKETLLASAREFEAQAKEAKEEQMPSLQSPSSAPALKPVKTSEDAKESEVSDPTKKTAPAAANQAAGTVTEEFDINSMF